jgi:hypothetical protein
VRAKSETAVVVGIVVEVRAAQSRSAFTTCTRETRSWRPERAMRADPQLRTGAADASVAVASVLVRSRSAVASDALSATGVASTVVVAQAARLLDQVVLE